MWDAALTQGFSALEFAYGAVQAPMLAGLVRGRSELRHYLESPLVAAPLAALAAIGMSAVTPALAAVGAGPHGIVQLTLGTALSAWMGYRTGLTTALNSEDSPVHRRGTLLDEHAPSRAGGQSLTQVLSRAVSRGLSRDMSRGMPRSQDGEITLAGAVVRRQDETKHFKLIGTTGTGKSTAIQEILGAALARGDRAIVADPDGGYMRRFYDPGRGDVVLNPFDPRSVKWDLFAEIKNPYDVEQLARSLIPDQEGADRSWRGYARTFFTAVTRQAHDSGIDDMAELFRLLVVADAKELRTLVRGTPAQPFLDEANSRMFDSIRSVTSSAVGAIEYVAQQKGDGFSVRQWVSQESPGVLFMPYKAGQIAALRSPISSWMRLAIFEAMDQEEQGPEVAPKDQRRLWFVVDELDALGQIDGLKDALARLRKFGGRVVLGFQSIAQVSSTYGQGDAHTIVENCANTLILRCSASEGGGTARFASQLIGDREIVRTTRSHSRRETELLGSVSSSEQYSVEPAVLPSQIEQLPDLAGYLKKASDPAWRRIRLDAVQTWREQRPARGSTSGWQAGVNSATGPRSREGTSHE